MALPMAPIPITAISDLELIGSFAHLRSRPNEATVGPMSINQSSNIYGAQFGICKASCVRTHDSIVLDRREFRPNLSTKIVVHRRRLSLLKIGDGRRIDFPYSYRAGWRPAREEKSMSHRVKCYVLITEISLYLWSLIGFGGYLLLRDLF
jgi:hypothetical protein